jgi:hypothetical protein
MVYFQTKNPDLGKIWRVLQLNELEYCMAIWSILQLFGIFMVFWHIFLRFGMLNQEKSGNPGQECSSENPIDRK